VQTRTLSVQSSLTLVGAIPLRGVGASPLTFVGAIPLAHCRCKLSSQSVHERFALPERAPSEKGDRSDMPKGPCTDRRSRACTDRRSRACTDRRKRACTDKYRACTDPGGRVFAPTGRSLVAPTIVRGHGLAPDSGMLQVSRLQDGNQWPDIAGRRAKGRGRSVAIRGADDAAQFSSDVV
jgi:hypothetical protein